MPLEEDALNIHHELNEELTQNQVVTSVELEDNLSDRTFYPIESLTGKERSKSPREAVDINEFFTLVQEVINFKLDKDGWKKRLIFAEEFSDKDDDADAEIITFGIEKRLPGIIEQTPNPLMRSAIRNRKPLYRETLPDRSNPGYSVIVEGQWFDNFIVFTCWARENKIANIRALWFEDLMREFEWAFRAHGVMIRYEGRDRDVEDNVKSRKVVGRPLRYLVRTERITRTFQKDIEELSIRLHLLERTADEEIRRI